MFWLVLGAATASAIEPLVLDYEVSFFGEPVGEQHLTVRFERTRRGFDRVIEHQAKLDGTPIDFAWTEKVGVAARASSGPATFNASVVLNGEKWSHEVRQTATSWLVTRVDAQGRAHTEELPKEAVDLSTIDLLDPWSHVSVLRYDSVRVLSAETGRIWQSKVKRLGPSEMTVDGTTLVVEGVALDPPEGRMLLYYSAEGVPVRVEYYVEGRELLAELKAAPPAGPDEHPVALTTADIEVFDL